MKTIILSLAIAVISLAACKNNSNNSARVHNNMDSITERQNIDVTETSSPVADGLNTSSISEIIINYLLLKNALAKDNTAEAAASGTKLEAALKNFDKTALSVTLKQIFEEVEDDAREHAEHIGANSGNIAHQREHFELLSKDVYDLLKTFSGGQVLYYTFCPMYNDGKGAYWISETREIKNPYLGKKMLGCGEIKEDLE